MQPADAFHNLPPSEMPPLSTDTPPAGNETAALRAISKSVKDLAALKQIIDEKEYTGIGSEEHQNTAQEINDTSITLYGDHTDCIPEGKTLVITTNAFNQTNIKNPLLLELNASDLISDSLNCDGMLIPIKPTEEEQADITAKAKNYDTIVFCSYNASIFTQQIDLTKKLEKLNKKIIYIAMRNPYDLAFFSQNRTRIAAYEYTPHSIQSVIKVLKGVLTPKGKLCVKI